MDNGILKQSIQNLTNTDKLKDNIINIVIYAFLFIFVIVSGILLTQASNNENMDYFGEDTRYFINIGLIVLHQIILIYLVTTGKSTNAYYFGIFVFVILMILLFGYIYGTISYLDTFYQSYINLFFFLFLLLIIFVGLAMFYNIFADRIRRIDGILGWFTNLIFFIPCLISDLFEYIKNQFKITSPVVYVLLAFQILLILVYIYIPRLLRSKLIDHGITLQNKPTFLNEAVDENLLNDDNLPRINRDNIVYKNNDTRFNTYKQSQTYTISMWIYLNQHHNSSVPKRVFEYGSESTGYKPKVEYLGVDNSQSQDTYYRSTSDTYKITIAGENNVDQIVYINMLNQKWNQLTFVYDGKKTHIYVNGILTKSVNIDNNEFKFDNQDKIKRGHKDLDGSICNIMYYDKTLTPFEITTYYNLLINKNPPVNNIL